MDTTVLLEFCLSRTCKGAEQRSGPLGRRGAPVRNQVQSQEAGPAPRTRERCVGPGREGRPRRLGKTHSNRLPRDPACHAPGPSSDDAVCS